MLPMMAGNKPVGDREIIAIEMEDDHNDDGDLDVVCGDIMDAAKRDDLGAFKEGMMNFYYAMKMHEAGMFKKEMKTENKKSLDDLLQERY